MVVDAGSILELFGVRTKKKAKDRAQWVTRFTVDISTDNTVWSSVDGGSIFAGPTSDDDREAGIDAFFTAPVSARYVKITVQAWEAHVAMRAGLLAGGCTPSPPPLPPSFPQAQPPSPPAQPPSPQLQPPWPQPQPTPSPPSVPSTVEAEVEDILDAIEQQAGNSTGVIELVSDAAALLNEEAVPVAMDGGGTAEREQRTELRSQLMASLNATVASLIATVLEPPIAPNGTATQEQAAAAVLGALTPALEVSLEVLQEPTEVAVAAAAAGVSLATAAIAIEQKGAAVSACGTCQLSLGVLSASLTASREVGSGVQTGAEQLSSVVLESLGPEAALSSEAIHMRLAPVDAAPMQMTLPSLGLTAVVAPSHAIAKPTAATFYAYDVHSSGHERDVTAAALFAAQPNASGAAHEQLQALLSRHHGPASDGLVAALGPALVSPTRQKDSTSLQLASGVISVRRISPAQGARLPPTSRALEAAVEENGVEPVTLSVRLPPAGGGTCTSDTACGVGGFCCRNECVCAKQHVRGCQLNLAARVIP